MLLLDRLLLLLSEEEVSSFLSFLSSWDCLLRGGRPRFRGAAGLESIMEVGSSGGGGYGIYHRVSN